MPNERIKQCPVTVGSLTSYGKIRFHKERNNFVCREINIKNSDRKKIYKEPAAYE